MAANQYNRKATEAELVYGTFIETEFRRSNATVEISRVCGVCGDEVPEIGTLDVRPVCRECDMYIESRIDSYRFAPDDNVYVRHTVPNKKRGLQKVWFEFDGRFWWRLLGAPASSDVLNRRPGIVKNARLLEELNALLPKKPEREVPEWAKNYKIPVDHTPKYLPGYNEFGKMSFDSGGQEIIDCDDCCNHEHWNGAFGGCSQHGDTCQLCCEKKAV